MARGDSIHFGNFIRKGYKALTKVEASLQGIAFSPTVVVFYFLNVIGATTMNVQWCRYNVVSWLLFLGKLA